MRKPSSVTVGFLAVLSLQAFGAPAAAQEGPTLETDGLLRLGFRIEPEAAERRTGFEVFDARLGLSGRVGLVFDYSVLGAWEGEDQAFRLLDARLSVPLAPEARLSFGQFKAPFGEEFMRRRADLHFLERFQASDAVGPGRQVGVSLSGEAMYERLTYEAGIFNGNGRRIGNDDGRFLYAARIQYNTVGPIEFYRDLVFQVGANVAFSRDSAARLGPGLEAPDAPGGGGPVLQVSPGTVDFGAFRGERLLRGLDARIAWRGMALSGEYLRGEFEPADLPGETLVAEGGYVQGSYELLGGAMEGVARWDAFNPAVGERRDFLLLGLNLYPGLNSRLGLQYAISLSEGDPPGARIAGDQFVFQAQVDF